MPNRLKKFLYQHLFSIAPQFVRELYFRDISCIPAQILEAQYDKALSFLKKQGRVGDYLEFGVFRGDSLTIMHNVLKKHQLTDVRLIGFDSFEGLPNITHPQDKTLPWQKGDFVSGLNATKANLNQAGIDWSKTFLIKGWFTDTLNQTTLNKLALRHASIAMLDCDLYSSTREALDFLSPLIRGHIILVFDDWGAVLTTNKDSKGQKLAFKHWLSKNPQLKATPFSSYSHIEQKTPYTAKIFLVTRQDSPN